MADLEQRVKELEDRVSALEAASRAAQPAKPIEKQQSPKEFLMAKAPKSVVEKTLALGYYHETVTGQGAFKSLTWKHCSAPLRKSCPPT